LVAITGHGFTPQSQRWRPFFEEMQHKAQVVLSVGLSGRFFAKHGTTIQTRLTVIDNTPAEDPKRFVGLGDNPLADPAALLKVLQKKVPSRQTMTARSKAPVVAQILPRKTVPVAQEEQPLPLVYDCLDWSAPSALLEDTLYERYMPQSVQVAQAKDHPSKLVQSAAMASIAPPKPSYQPHLCPSLVTEGKLSEAQLESIIYAGEAHQRVLVQDHCLNHTHDFATEADKHGDKPVRTVRFRQGWFLGDGTGCGKGRQVAGIIMDNRAKGRKKAIWISKNDKLLEDARRDWEALGGQGAQVVPLSHFKQGQDITLEDGILFLTYGMVRSAARGAKASRLQQIVDWAGLDFDGPLMFDESHALANAATSQGNRGERLASKQGIAGLRLQRALADARVCYVSATGATSVHNLAYAERLGLWGDGTAFQNRSSFISAMESGGVAAMEVISRDLKALGLYTARSLSYDGVEVDLLEHKLTEQQINIYDQYATAYHHIHQNLEHVLAWLNIDTSLNRNARMAALSTFESSKQRFFSHILTAMKCPTLIKAIEADLEQGNSVIVQVVSTGESLLERRLSEIPVSEWSDLTVDVTPRDYVMGYVQHAFPTQLYETYQDDNGKAQSRPMVDSQGNPVLNKKAVALRDQLLETLASLPPLPSGLDQIIQHFGADKVAEITGRKTRLLRQDDRLFVDKRSAASNLEEAAAYMNDEKQILIFSDAGGTGRSYHADRSAKNQRRRIHYLLEAGWRADAAIQGLGRSNRTNQASAPVFRPVATDVKGEKRFLSTIARRLDTLGAITKGQRQTGGQGMFRSDDNLESPLAKSALRQLYRLLARGEIKGCSLDKFEQQTGLSLLGEGGALRDELPPMSRFLNRVLAMTIAEQNSLFEHFETVMAQLLEQAKATGLFDAGVETIKADHLSILESTDVYTDPRSGAVTRCVKMMRKDKLRPLRLGDVKAKRRSSDCYVRNSKTGRVALVTTAPSRMTENGAVLDCIRLVRPLEQQTYSLMDFERTKWQDCSEATFDEGWAREVADAPEYKTSTFHMICGTLLPIWDKVPNGTMRIYRLQTEDNQRLLGLILDQDAVRDFYQTMGLEVAPLSEEELWDMLEKRGRKVDLVQGLRLSRRLVMGEDRIEVENIITPEQFDRLEAMGCYSEIIQYRRRLFVPTGDAGQAVLATLLKSYPLKA